MLQSIFETVTILLSTRAREILKVVTHLSQAFLFTWPERFRLLQDVCYCSLLKTYNKVAITCLRVLKAHFRFAQPVVQGITSMSSDNIHHFKMPIRVIFERLLRRIGYGTSWCTCAQPCLREDALRSLTPPEHHRLITHIRKQRERQKRTKEQVCVQASSKYLISKRPPMRHMMKSWQTNQKVDIRKTMFPRRPGFVMTKIMP